MLKFRVRAERNARAPKPHENPAPKVMRETGDLNSLSKVVHELAEHIAELGRRTVTPPEPTVCASSTDAVDPSWLVLAARAELQARRFREELLPSDLFFDPAWDMLLDLFIAHHMSQPVFISSVCLAATVPTTTALRWLGKIEEHGLIEREDDPSDRRRAFVRLRPATEAAIAHWLVTRAPPPAIEPQDKNQDRVVAVD